MRSITIIDSYLDRRSSNSDGIFHVKVRVTFRRKTRYYKTGLKWTENTYAEVSKKNPRSQYNFLKEELNVFLERAHSIIKTIPTFSQVEFENLYYQSTNEDQDIIGVYDEIISFFEKNESFNTAITYKCSKNLIGKYFNPFENKKLQFDSITTKGLNDFKTHYESEGKSKTTLSMYLRCLKRVYNYAIEKKYLNSGQSPFTKAFKIPNVNNIKKALNPTDLKQIINYKPITGSQLEKSIDFWLLSFYCSGMNLNDILRLRNKDLDGDFITFIRKKTLKSNNTNIASIQVPLNDQVKVLISKYRNSDTNSESFLFPYLTGNHTSEEISVRIRSFIRMINRQLKSLEPILGISKITTYSARHSFATLAINQDVSIKFISESLGHTNITTTEKYIKSLGTETLKKTSAKVFEGLF